MSLATCIGCGCDDFHACGDGCYWLRVDYGDAKGVCSECEQHLDASDRGDRTSHSLPISELEAEEEGKLRRPRPEQPKPAGILPACSTEIRDGKLVHVHRAGHCPHDWPFEDIRDDDACRWCGMTFLRHVFTEMP